MTKPHSPQAFDAVIAGGGMAGLTLATRLGTSGFKVAVIERATPERLASPENDGRTTALAYGSKLILEECSVWEKIAGDASPIKDIRVADQQSSAMLDFESAALGDNPFGYVIENTLFRKALFARVEELKNVTLFCPAEIRDVMRDEEEVRVTLDNGTRITSQVLAAADGRRSSMREGAGIKLHEWSYNETALIATIQHSEPHENLAIENFYPGGPFAVLPLTHQRSAIVWTEKPDTANTLFHMEEEAFTALLTERGCAHLGEISLASPRQLYPLHFMLAENLHDTRMVLIGEAAHAMHPIAGQGFNLSMRDIAALGDVLDEARDQGGDLGSDTVLEKYESKRHLDHFTFLTATDMLVKLFSNNFPPMRLLRQLGLGLVQKLQPAKNFFGRMAMGLLT